MKYLIYFFIGFIIYRWICPKKAGLVVNVYFGVPGSGKTTFASFAR